MNSTVGVRLAKQYDGTHLNNSIGSTEQCHGTPKQFHGTHYYSSTCHDRALNLETLVYVVVYRLWILKPHPNTVNG